MWAYGRRQVLDVLGERADVALVSFYGNMIVLGARLSKKEDSGSRRLSNSAVFDDSTDIGEFSPAIDNI